MSFSNGPELWIQLFPFEVITNIVTHLNHNSFSPDVLSLAAACSSQIHPAIVAALPTSFKVPYGQNPMAWTSLLRPVLTGFINTEAGQPSCQPFIINAPNLKFVKTRADPLSLGLLAASKVTGLHVVFECSCFTPEHAHLFWHVLSKLPLLNLTMECCRRSFCTWKLFKDFGFPIAESCPQLQTLEVRCPCHLFTQRGTGLEEQKWFWDTISDMSHLHELILQTKVTQENIAALRSIESVRFQSIVGNGIPKKIGTSVKEMTYFIDRDIHMLSTSCPELTVLTLQLEHVDEDIVMCLPNLMGSLSCLRSLKLDLMRRARLPDGLLFESVKRASLLEELSFQRIEADKAKEVIQIVKHMGKRLKSLSILMMDVARQKLLWLGLSNIVVALTYHSPKLEKLELRNILYVGFCDACDLVKKLVRRLRQKLPRLDMGGLESEI